MAQKNTSIHINGKRYDAVTGVVVSGSTIIKPQPVTPKPMTTLGQPASRSIDGMVSGTKVHPVTPVRHPAAHVKAHAAKPAATLMRRAVVKPAAKSLKRQAKPQGVLRSTHALPSTVQLAKKLSAYNVNDKRLKRAAAATTSPRIAHFAHQLATNTPFVIEETTQAFTVPTPAPVNHHVRAIITPAVAPKPNDVFQQAILRATSHEQPAPAIRSKKHRKLSRALHRRMVTYSGGAVAILALVGVFGYANATTIQYKLAANRAGFAATIPGYKPAGYSISGVQASSGHLAVTFVADQAGGAEQFALNEKPSNWSEHDVLINLVNTNENSTYQTIQQGGRTVYQYNKNHAAWVSNGVLYQVVGNADLSPRDLGQIAASM